MSWQKGEPQQSTKVKDSPPIFQGNWSALEEWTGEEHQGIETATLAGQHIPGFAGVVYTGAEATLSGAFSAPPSGSMGIVTDPVSGCLKMVVCTNPAGSGTWADKTPSHLWLTDSVSGDPHTQYIKKAGDTMVGSLYASGAPVSGNEVATKTYVDSTVASLKFMAATVNIVTWTASATWTDVDISANTGADTAKAALLAVSLTFYDTTVAGSVTVLFRKNGSSATAILPRLTGRSDAFGRYPVATGMIIVECDGSEIFEVKLQTDVGSPASIILNVDLIGYWI